MNAHGVMPLTSLLVALRGREAGGVVIEVHQSVRGVTETLLAEWELPKHGSMSGPLAGDVGGFVAAAVVEALTMVLGVQDVLPFT